MSARPLLLATAAIVAALALGGCSDRLAHPLVRVRDEPAPAAPLDSLRDTIVFGDPVSERDHELATEGSDVVAGGLGEPARRLLPADPAEIYGGQLSFVMKVDPGRQNYFTAKFWGSDVADPDARLFLYCEGRQVGYRNQGDHEVLHEFSAVARVPGRFVYVTAMLPMAMTSGRDSVTVQIVSSGRIAPFNQDTYEGYQRTLTVPTGGIYRAYTHILPFFEIGSERQGTEPVASARPAPPPNALADVQSYVDGLVTRWLSASELLPHEVLVLAMAYRTSSSLAFENPAVIDKIVEQIDAAVVSQRASPERYAGGLLAPPPLGVVDPFYPELSDHIEHLKGAGPLGAAVDLVYPELTPRLSEAVTLDAPEPSPRAEHWAALLETSRDQLRTSSRGQLLPEHELLVDTAIYQANLGLARLAPERALPEAVARRYLYEATGVLPALGNDTPSGSARPFGSAYYMFSRAGLGRSLGYASAHGELVDRLVYLWDLTHDPKLRERAVLTARARAFFRYPALDPDGHRAMRLEGVIGARTAEYPAPIVYAARRTELAAAAAFLEPDLLGHAQQALADHQVLDRLEPLVEPAHVERLLRLPAQYAVVSQQPASGARLPMTPGQPDAVFADEDAGVVAIRRGDDILYVSLFRRALAVTGVARVHHVRHDLERIATIEADVQFATDGAFWTRPDVVDWMPGGSAFEPPGALRQAFAGERALLARPPAGAVDSRPFDGKASFYRLHYGPFLIGMNASADRSYRLPLPRGVQTAEDVAAGRPVSADVVVEPRSTRVLYVAVGSDTRPVPYAPRFLATEREGGDVTLDWDPVSGASSYRVERAASPGGPYSMLAASVTESALTDQTSAENQTYCYVVTAENAYGTSAPSPELCVGAR